MLKLMFKQKLKLCKETDNQLRDSMLIIIMLPLTKQIKLFLLLIPKTLDGKPTHVNSKSTTPNMAHIAIKLLTSLKSQDQKQRKLNSYKLKPKSKQKLKFSVIKQMISKRFSRKFNNGVKNIRMLKTFRMKLFQKITISEISKGMISLVKLEIKAVVGHAILYLSLKLLNLDLK